MEVEWVLANLSERVHDVKSGEEVAEESPQWHAGAARLVATVGISRIENTIIRSLERVREVDAIFCQGDPDDEVVRAFVVTKEHDDAVYLGLLEAERLVRNALPEVELDFRVRAHQGRPLRQAVPVGSSPIFVR